MKKTLYMVRHGQTLFNLMHKIQGWCDSPLTDLGISQAKAVGDYFKANGITFDHAYSSTSERACDTLECITDMPYTRLKGLKEWNFGRFEGESERLNPKGPYADFFVYYDGEAQDAVGKRMHDTLSMIMEKEDHQTVLAVSHGGACFAFMLSFMDDVTHHISNGCIMKFEVEDGNFHLVEIIQNPLG